MHMKYIRCTLHFYGLVHINDIVVSTYEIHQMLSACYIRSLLLLILTVGMKHLLLYYSFIATLVFIHRSFLLNLVLLLSAELFAVRASLQFMWFKLGWGWRIPFAVLSQFSNCSTASATRIFDP